jgi:protein arginine kinase activator
MLICQICKQRTATVHFTRVINGKKVEMYVCERCARENSEIKVNIHNLLSGILGMDAKKGIASGTMEMITCPSCGMTAREFNKTGMLGCTNCYNVFNDSIQTLLKRIHGNVKHHGKIPIKMTGKIMEAKNLLKLKEELQKCIQEENYEQAAVIRDKIREIEKLREQKVR